MRVKVVPLWMVLILCFFLNDLTMGRMAEGQHSQPSEAPGELEQELEKTDEIPQRLAILGRLVTQYRQEEPLKASRYGKEALKLLENHRDDPLKVTVLNGLCWAYGELGDFREALDAGNRAEALARQLDDKKQLAVALSSLANIYLNLSEFHKALDYSLRAKTASDAIGYKRGAASALVSTARINRHLGEFEEALKNYKDAMRLTEELGFKVNVAWILNNMATVYWNMKQFDKALSVYNRGLKMMRDVGSRVGEAFVLNNIACVYSDIGKYQEALHHDRQSLAVYEALGSKPHIGHAYRNIGRDYGSLKEYKKGLDYLDRSLELAEEMGIKDLKKTVFEEYTRLYEHKGDFRQALYYHKKFKQMGDQLLGDDRNKRIAHLQVIYDVEKKQKENLLLKQNNHIQGLALERQRILGYFLILVIVFVVIIALFIYNRYLMRKKAQQVLQQSENKLKKLNSAKDRLFTIIAHDLGSPLNSLLLSSGHLSRHFKKLPLEDVEEFIQDIYRQTRGLSDLLENLLQWASVQTGKLSRNPESVDIRTLTEETVEQIKYSVHKKEIHLNARIMENSMAWADKHMMKAVIRNLLSNAVKYTHRGGEISISSKDTGDSIKITVADNGVGMETEKARRLFEEELNQSTRGTENEKGTGLGLTLCKEFVETNGGEIWVHSELQQGTQFSFTLPKEGAGEE